MIAIEEEKITSISYQSQSMTEPATRDVHPYGMTYHKGSLYLVAFAPDHDAVRIYKVDRIADAAVSDFPFQRPEDFDLARHFERSFGVFQGDGEATIRVRFLPPVVRYVQEKTWHSSQVVETQRDGGLVVEWRLSHTEEIKHWLLSFGANAQILAPEELRRQIADEARAISALYEIGRAHV